MTRIELIIIASKLKNNESSVTEDIDKLTNAQRVEVRLFAELMGVKELPRNLFFNYTTQEWIEGPDFPKVTGKCDGGNSTYDGSTICEEEKCQSCCPHDERDHGICLACEDEDDGSGDIDRAHDSMDMER